MSNNAYLDRECHVRYIANNGTIGATIGATVPLYRAPEACEVLNPYFVNFGTSIAGSNATDYFNVTLLNGGTAGTALTPMGGTTCSSVADGWTIRQPVAMSLSTSSKLAAGQWLVAKVDHVGSGLRILPYVSFEITRGAYSD